jgi:hypothetical protein
MRLYSRTCIALRTAPCLLREKRESILVSSILSMTISMNRELTADTISHLLSLAVHLQRLRRCRHNQSPVTAVAPCLRPHIFPTGLSQRYSAPVLGGALYIKRCTRNMKQANPPRQLYATTFTSLLPVCRSKQRIQDVNGEEEQRSPLYTCSHTPAPRVHWARVLLQLLHSVHHPEQMPGRLGHAVVRPACILNLRHFARGPFVCSRLRLYRK